MHVSTAQRGIFLASCTILLTALTGCSSEASFDRVGSSESKQLARDCPMGAALNSLDVLDGSGSSQSEVLLAARWDVVRVHLVQTAVCGGHARVVLVSSSSASSILLLDSGLRPSGATENAQLRRVDGVVDEKLEQVKTAYAAALPSLDANGTDMTAAYFALSDYIDERDGVGGDQVYSAQIETDGIQNVGVNLGDPSLTAASAKSLAASFAPPRFDDRVSVSFLGIGKVAGSEQPSTEYVSGLKAFWSATCEATGAGSCTVLTDFAGGAS